jgi:hypothetical protein
MHQAMQSKLTNFLCGGLAMLTLSLPCGQGAPGLEPVQLSPDGKSFVTGPKHHPFRVWGVNYDHDSTGEGRLLEDYWEHEWDTVRADFQEMKELGANVVRIHLQLGKFMTSADEPNQKSLERLTQLLELAEQTGLYLDVTGLGCYHKAATPKWYDSLDETSRWNVQSRFWTAVARTCRKSAAVFCYDLMNEPVIGGNTAEGWLSGELGGKCYVQRLTLNQGDRTNVAVAKAWVEQLTAAIRQEDLGHLITVGVIPWALVWPTAKPIFYAPEVIGALDFVSIHLYPAKGEAAKALTALTVYDLGKPLVIEETFPLSCSLEEMDAFIQQSKAQAEGYVSFYWGRTAEEYEKAKDKPEVAALMRSWLQYFRKQAESMKRP